MAESTGSKAPKSAPRRVLVYGGGVAALMTALELAHRGLAVDLVGPAPARCWPSLSEAGINTGSDAEALYRQTIACGGYLAPRPPVRQMAIEADSLVCWLASIGVPFQRDETGALARRRLDGAVEADAAFVEGQTAAQIAHALEGQVARLSEPPAEDGKARGDTGAGLIRRYEPYDLLALALDDDQRCIGCITQDLVSMDLVALAADAVVLAAGGPELMFGSPSRICTESAAAVALEAGAVFANADLVQRHPATITMPEGRRYVLSSAIRAESGRFWVPRDEQDVRIAGDIPKAERDYFLAQDHPGFGDLVPDDIAARAVQRICRSERRGVYDRQQRSPMPVVYLDISHLPEATVADRLGSEAVACRRLTGIDPAKAPLQVTAAATLSLGGLWADFEPDSDGGLADPSPRNHSTSIQGLYAASGVGHLYHGCCRMGGNGLLVDLLGGRLTARAVEAYCDTHPVVDPEDGALSEAADQAAARYAALLDRPDDPEARTPAELGMRLRAAMDRLLTDEPSDELVELARKAVGELSDQATRCCPDDWCEQANRGAPMLRDLLHMLRFAELVVESTAARLAHNRTTPQTVLARFDGAAIEALDSFSHSRAGEVVEIDGAIDPADLPPASRRYRDEKAALEDDR
jgi:succinate dehydrogenase / fumarate reductase flavoprotein subunit